MPAGLLLLVFLPAPCPAGEVEDPAKERAGWDDPARKEAAAGSQISGGRRTLPPWHPSRGPAKTVRRHR